MTEDKGFYHRDDYGFMEREVAFKLLASHAMVDAEFFELLRKDPVEAARQLHIALDERDLEYFKAGIEGNTEEGPNWEALSAAAPTVREALNLEKVTNSW